ncbi:MAG: hypothetical protein ACTSPB_01295 [Candidatus Thorarchaeota archaeon]
MLSRRSDFRLIGGLILFTVGLSSILYGLSENTDYILYGAVVLAVSYLILPPEEHEIPFNPEIDFLMRIITDNYTRQGSLSMRDEEDRDILKIDFEPPHPPEENNHHESSTD